MRSVIYYIKKYPISITIILVVIYLSFFKPPTIEPLRFQGFDKIVHFCMYGVMSGVLWIEFLRNHKDGVLILRHAFIGAALLPILFSGLVEIFQERLTTYRGGDWYDFLANISGVIFATIFAWFVLRPIILKKKDKS